MLDGGNEPRAQMWPIAISSLPPKLPLAELTASSTHTNTDDVFFTAPGDGYMRFANAILSVRGNLRACSAACTLELPANRTSCCQTPFCRERLLHHRSCEQERQILNELVFDCEWAGIVPDDGVELSAAQADGMVPGLRRSMH